MMNLLLYYLIISRLYALAFASSECEPVEYQPCGDFDLSFGKANLDTRLWLLGELHPENKKTINCIELLTKNVATHNIYVENNGRFISCEKVGISPRAGRTCHGWDSAMDAELAVRHSIKDIQTYLAHINAERIKYQATDDQMDKLCKVLLTKPSLKEALQHHNKLPFGIKSLKDMIEHFLEQRRVRNVGYETLFFELKKELNQYLAQAEQPYAALMHADCKSRNQHMIDSIKNNTADVFTIVVAGKAHLKPTFYNDFGVAYSDICQAEMVRDYLQQARSEVEDYAILAMK